MLENKVSRVTATLVAATMFNGCIAPQTYSWKMESVVSTAYKEVGEETKAETRYKVSHSISDSGTLSINVKKQDYEVEYDVLQPIQTQRQRQYAYGKSKVVAAVTEIGLGSLAVATVIGLTTQEPHCSPYNPDFCPSTRPHDSTYVFLATGMLATGIGGFSYFSNPKKTRPTRNYQTVEVELDKRETKQTGEHILDIIPAISAPLEIASSYFTIGETGHTLTTKTNVMGNVTVQLYPSSPNFAFTLDKIADIDAAQQLHDAGYKVERYLPLLEQAAVPVSYDVHAQTKATDGKNAEVTIPVKGYEVSQKALEQVVMSL